MTEELAEAKVRGVINQLVRLASAGKSLDHIEGEFNAFYRDFISTHPDQAVFALRRLEDVRLLFFVDEMSDADKNDLYVRYCSYGFDDAVTKLHCLLFLYRSAAASSAKEGFLTELIPVIDDLIDDESARTTYAEYPEVAERIRLRSKRN